MRNFYLFQVLEGCFNKGDLNFDDVRKIGYSTVLPKILSPD